MPACGTRGRSCASSGRWSSSSTTARHGTRSSSSRRSSTSPIRARCWSASRHCCSRRGRVHQHAEPADARPPGAERSGNPWHVREYTAEEYRELLEPHFSAVELLGLFHARKLRLHELALRLGWDRVHPALGLDRRFYDRFVPAIGEGDFALRRGGARRRARLPGGVPAVSPLSAGTTASSAIVLHSHMPYVEGFGTWPFGEEWLFEAIAASYVPLIELLERWAGGGTGSVVTIGVTPVLADQLVLPEVGERFLSFMRGVRAECHRLDSRAWSRRADERGRGAAALGARDYERAADDFERLGGDLLGALRRLRDAGAVELWTSAATHAVLPLLATEAGVRLQLRTGIECAPGAFRRLERRASGCRSARTAPGVEEQLATAGVRAFCVDQTESRGRARPARARRHGRRRRSRCRSTGGRSRWSGSEHGYPADRSTATITRQTLNGMRPWANGGGPTTRGGARARPRARARLRRAVVGRLDRYRAARGRPGLVVCALDTELLGHWWYEGPRWLERVVEEARGAGLALAHASGGARAARARRTARSASRAGGAARTCAPGTPRRVAHLAWAARTAELALVRRALGAGHAAGRRGIAATPSARRGSCWRSSRATGRSWRRASSRATTRAARARAHVGAFERGAVRRPAGRERLPPPCEARQRHDGRHPASVCAAWRRALAPVRRCCEPRFRLERRVSAD